MLHENAKLDLVNHFVKSLGKFKGLEIDVVGFLYYWDLQIIE